MVAYRGYEVDLLSQLIIQVYIQIHIYMIYIYTKTLVGPVMQSMYITLCPSLKRP